MNYNALQQIQQRLNAPKDKTNNFGKYKYRSCEGILEALKPLLAELGVVVILSDDIVEVAGRVYVKATATLADKDGSEIEHVTAFAREEQTKSGMDAAQITGSASSYARKYALNGLFAIDDTKDPDTNEQQVERTARARKGGAIYPDKEEKDTEQEKIKAMKMEILLCGTIKQISDYLNAHRDYYAELVGSATARKNELIGQGITE